MFKLRSRITENVRWLLINIRVIIITMLLPISKNAEFIMTPIILDFVMTLYLIVYLIVIRYVLTTFIVEGENLESY